MPWSPETANINQADFVSHLVVPYTRGKGLDIMTPRAARKCWPRMIGVSNNPNSPCDINGNPDDMGLFANGSMDFVFSSYLLQLLKPEQRDKAIREWTRVIRLGGHLIIHVPLTSASPKEGEPGYEEGATWNIDQDAVPKLVDALTGCGWDFLEAEDRSVRPGEWGLFYVFRKRDDGVFNPQLWQRHPQDKKRALVIRYGAIGDHLIASSILPHLKSQGFHISYYTHGTANGAAEILKHDPNIDEFILVDVDQVPNASLGPYWDTLRADGRYDFIVNLSESLEGALLTIPGRIPHSFSHEARHKLLDVNYSEYIHDIVSAPYKIQNRFYMSPEEESWAKAERAKFDGPVVCWAITGTSYHKTYPFIQVVAKWLAEQTPAHIVLLGDPDIGATLQWGIMEALKKDGVDTSRIHPMAGVWKVREALSFVQFAEVMVGPETGLLNAVANNEAIHKVIYLSHSSKENLTKHWNNTNALEPDRKSTPCYPCHMLHYTWDHCHKVESTGAALCATNTSPERIFGAIAKALIKKENAKPSLVLPKSDFHRKEVA